MKLILSLLLIYSDGFITLSYGNLKYFDSYGDGKIAYGASEDVVANFSKLLNVRELPDTFTICNSVFIQYRTSNVHFFNLHQDDGSPWLTFFLKDIFQSGFKEDFLLVFNEEFYGLGNSPVPVVPHSWYRGCLSLDTRTGKAKVVSDGFKVFEEEIDYFKESKRNKPKNLNLVVLKMRIPGLWYQVRGRFSNLQIYSRVLSDKEMIRITSNGSVDCFAYGDFLAWNEMKWENVGQIVSGEVDTEKMCTSKKPSRVYFDVNFRNWEWCMQICPKFYHSRVPSCQDLSEMNTTLQWIRNTVTSTEVSDRKPVAVWVPISDRREEGTWLFM